MAPPGWDWKPPTGDEPVPVAAAAPAPAVRAGESATDGVLATGRKPAPLWDARLTIALLIIGVLGVFTFVQVQNSIPQAIATLYQQEGLGSYTPAASVSGIITGGLIAQVALWFVAAAISITLLLRRRRAFWVLLAFGVISVITMMGIILAVMLTDPTLLGHMESTRL